MPPNTEPEIEGPVTWCVEYHLPNALFVKYFGEDAALGGEGFRANFYKCVRLPPPTFLAGPHLCLGSGLGSASALAGSSGLPALPLRPVFPPSARAALPAAASPLRRLTLKNPPLVAQADHTSHPHWGCWSPVETEAPSFHQPDYFRPLAFSSATAAPGRL